MELETKFASNEASDLSHSQNITSNESNEPANGSIDLDLVLKDLAAGSMAGVANVLSGHPFDTIKVRMQMLDTRLSTCVKNIIYKEGPASFYKGVYSPLYSIPVINAIVFGAYEIAKRFLSPSPDAEMTITQGMMAGAFAGLVNCLVVTPVELIKCRQQMEGMGSKAAKTTSSIELMKHIYKNHGFSGLYKGNLITIGREMPAYAAQFGTYEVLKNYLVSHYGESTVLNFSAGAAAGFMCWVFSYPQDIIKTKLQCDFGGAVRHYKSHPVFRDGGVISCAKDIWRQEGLRGFWRGFSACTMRAMIANAFTFVAYEEAKKIFI